MQTRILSIEEACQLIAEFLKLDVLIQDVDFAKLNKVTEQLRAVRSERTDAVNALNQELVKWFDAKRFNEIKFAGQTFSDVLYSATLSLTDVCPINNKDFATQAPISPFTKIVTSDGYQHEIDSICLWKKPVNPFTRTTFHQRDLKRMTEIISQEYAGFKFDADNPFVIRSFPTPATSMLVPRPRNEVAHTYIPMPSEPRTHDIFYPFSDNLNEGNLGSIYNFFRTHGSRRLRPNEQFITPSPVSAVIRSLPIRQLPGWISHAQLAVKFGSHYAIVPEHKKDEVLFIDSSTDQPSYSVTNPSGKNISSLAVLPNGKLAVGNYEDTPLHILDSVHTPIPQHLKLGYQCLFSSGNFLVFAQKDPQSYITLIDLHTNNRIVKHGEILQINAMTVNDQYIFVVGFNRDKENICCIYDFNFRLNKQFDVNIKSSSLEIDLFNHDKLIVSGNNQINIYNYVTGICERITTDMLLISTIASLENGNIVITGQHPSLEPSSRLIREYSCDGEMVREAKIQGRIQTKPTLLLAYDRLEERHEFTDRHILPIIHGSFVISGGRFSH